MYTIIRRLFLVIMPLMMLSCIKENGDELCNIYLEFVFDYNMEYADSFDPQVETVDVYIFDDQGKYLLRKSADTRSELVEGKRMTLRNEVPRGTYKILTVGGMSEYFSFTDFNDRQFTEGVTTIEEVKLALRRETNAVSLEFPHLWFGEAITVTHNGNGSVWPVPLVRNTNIFHITVHDMDATRADGGDDTDLYTFDITTPEAGVYGYDNKPLEQRELTYQPYDITRGEGSGSLSTGKLNTMRLFADYTDGYRLVVRDPDTSGEVWSYDLITLLRNTKPATRPDGTTLPMQEYLDRQGDWNIVILTRRQTGEGNYFLAVGVEVNDWIVWFSDIGV